MAELNEPRHPSRHYKAQRKPPRNDGAGPPLANLAVDIETAVRVDGLAGDEARRVAAQELNNRCDFLRLSEAAERRLRDKLVAFRCDEIPSHLGGDDARRYRVHARFRRQLDRQATHQAEHPTLGRGIVRVERAPPMRRDR